MKTKLSTTALTAVIASAIALGAFANGTSQPTTNLSQEAFNQIVQQGVPANALREGLKAEKWATKHGKVRNKRYLTIVEFNRPSTEKRMQVIDLKNKRVLFNELVAQGSGSGPRNVPSVFSDRTGSHSSVRGILVTSNIYYGKHGKSLRLKGLESFNRGVLSRDIVVHGAWYATPSFEKAHGYLGHSWGCFAVAPNIAPKIIKLIKNGSVLFAYAPQAGKDPNID